MLDQFPGIVGQYFPVMDGSLRFPEIEVVPPGSVNDRRQRHLLFVLFLQSVLDIAVPKYKPPFLRLILHIFQVFTFNS